MAVWEERRGEPKTIGRTMRPDWKADASFPQVKARRSGESIPDSPLLNQHKIQQGCQGVLEVKPVIRGASQGWTALIFLLQGTVHGKRGLSPTTKMDFKAQCRALSQLSSLEQEVCE
ncbi:unnamed protein product [Rangifer tarandus platyrhynchus]|uniref:Uncharacterized protein n=1 Tax=Rangifer tarandus platyrhynchus TaxID=3082113 RepID=A0ABN9A339_RANTA|nr:unnamed protein product [Rangifer tarandus platyrhynchus]